MVEVDKLRISNSIHRAVHRVHPLKSEQHNVIYSGTVGGNAAFSPSVKQMKRSILLSQREGVNGTLAVKSRWLLNLREL